MLRWKVHNDDPPRQVECKEHGWPNEDAEGDAQYINSHFDDPAPAWEKALAEARAWVRMEEREIRQCEARLAKARADLDKARESLAAMRKAAAEAGFPEEQDPPEC